MWRLNFSPKYKNIIVVGTILVIAALVGIFLTGHIEQLIIQERMEQAKTLTSFVHHTLQNSYSSVKNETNKEKIKNEKQNALEQIRKFNYQNNNYVWIMSIDGIMVMHPKFPELEGKDVLPVTDIKGNFVFPRNYTFEFPEAEEQGVFHSYFWPKMNHSDYTVKVSHLRSFLPYYWIIGTGVYLDDMRQIRLKIWLVYLSSIIAPLILIIFWVLRSTIDEIPKILND